MGVCVECESVIACDWMRVSVCNYKCLCVRVTVGVSRHTMAPMFLWAHPFCYPNIKTKVCGRLSVCEQVYVSVRHYEKSNLQTNTFHEHGRENPQQNISKLNSAMHKNSYTP